MRTDTADTVGALVAGPAPADDDHRYPVIVTGGARSGTMIGQAYAKAVPIRGKKVAGFHETQSWVYTADQLRSLADLVDLVDLVDASADETILTVEGVPIR